MSPSKPENGEIKKDIKKEVVDDDDVQVHPDDADDLIIKDVADGSDEIVDEVGEIDKRQFEEDISKQLEISRSNDGTTVDNEDSLNLTIGEDEEKIFQEEETEVKESSKGDSPPKKSEKKENKSNESTTEKKSSSSTTNKADDGAESKSSSSGDKKTENESSSNSNNKKDDSDQKATSTKSSSKDEKESASKSSTSTKTPASRNLWVSGLSSLTRATDLKIIFSKYGKVIGAKVVTNTRTPGTRCYGYVTMGSSSDASKCIEHLHRTELHGRIISVEKAKSDIGIAKTTKPEIKIDDAGSAEKKEDRKKSDKDDTKSDTKKETSKREEKPSDDSKKRDSEKKRDTERVRVSANSSKEREPVRKIPPPVQQRRVDRDREVLSFQKIREERERQRLRERERKIREEERRRQESRRRQRDEEERLMRERERLKKERVRLERERADLLRLERERQKLEREKIELERLELKRQQLKIEEAKRAIKRPATDHERDRYPEVERKRATTDRRFEPPPPPRFDTSISRSSAYERSTEKKRIDDYPPPKREEYKRDNFKRPVPEYTKRDIDPPRHASSTTFESRGVGMHRGEPISSGSSKDRYGSSSENRGGPSSFSSRVRDEREPRTNGKPRYMDESSNNDSRYTDRNSSSTWPNTGPPSVKPFGHIQSVAGNDPWGQKQSEGGWRSMEQNQDRYDRTYNERKSQSGPSQYIDQPRQNSFISRPQDRYSNNISSRFENGRF